jgi:hypothetical protein
MIKFTSYFQHHWWLYICWLIQMPAICFIIFMGIVVYAHRGSLTATGYA